MEDEKLLSDYIQELLAGSEIKDALGKYVWPTADRNYLKPDENDTKVEEYLYRELHKHFAGKGTLSSASIEIIKRILDAGAYQDVFKRCKEGQIHRGMRLPISWLEQYAPEALESLPDEIDTVEWKNPVKVKPFTYPGTNDYGQVSSWTANWDKARRFTRMWSANTVPVIIHSDCSSGYFMQTWPFKRFKDGRYKEEFGIPSLLPYSHEKEILLFGNCVVTHVQVNATKKDIEKIKLRSMNENIKESLKNYIKETIEDNMSSVNHEEILSKAKSIASNPKDIPEIETLHQNIAHMTIALKELETRMVRVAGKMKRLNMEDDNKFLLPLANCINKIKEMIKETENRLDHYYV